MVQQQFFIWQNVLVQRWHLPAFYLCKLESSCQERVHSPLQWHPVTEILATIILLLSFYMTMPQEAASPTYEGLM